MKLWITAKGAAALATSVLILACVAVAYLLAAFGLWLIAGHSVWIAAVGILSVALSLAVTVAGVLEIFRRL